MNLLDGLCSPNRILRTIIRNALETLVLARMIIACVVLVFVAAVGVYVIVTVSVVVVIEVAIERLAHRRDVDP